MKRLHVPPQVTRITIAVIRILAPPLLFAIALLISERDLVKSALKPGIEQENSSKSEDYLRSEILALKGYTDVPSPRVTAVAVGTGKLAYLHENHCDGRLFMTDLLRRLEDLRTQIIVIDKYYTENYCSDPNANQGLIDALKENSAKIVVARHTSRSESAATGAELSYDSPMWPPSSRIVPGLVRVNINPEKIPLQWNVIPQEASGENSKVRPGWDDTLPFAAAKLADPSLQDRVGLRQFLSDHRDPYISFRRSAIQTVDAVDVLCGDPARTLVFSRSKLVCPQTGGTVPLQGIVVVGDASQDDDQWTLAGSSLYGFQLQATYIEALLDGTYFKEVPKSLWLVVVFVWIIVTQTGVAISKRPWPFIIIASISSMVLIALSVMALTLFNYITPVAAIETVVLNIFLIILLESVEKVLNLGEPP